MMHRIEFILDEIDIENAIREYCIHNLQIPLSGMRTKIKQHPDIQFPECCVLVAEKMEKHT